jgi:hypothetical protein
MGDCQLSEKIRQRKHELQMLFDKIMSVEDQYKELGTNDSEFEDKL